MELDERTSKMISTLTLSLVAVLVVRSLVSFISLFNTLSLILVISESTIGKVYQNMLKQFRRFSITVLATLVLIAVAVPMFATAASTNQYDQQVLTDRYNLVSAHVTFTTGYLNDVSSAIQNASNLQAPSSKLTTDLSTLNGYVTSNDPSGFCTYVKDTMTPDFQSAQAALKADQQQYKAWGVTADTRKQLNTDYQNLKTQYESQVSSIESQLYSQLLADEINTDNAAIQKNDQVIANMSSKGYDVSGMQAVQGYGHAVVSKLQSVQGSDPTIIKNMLKSECLGNGATYSEHYYAEFDLARLQSVSAKLSPIVASSNNAAAQQAFAAANNELNSASSTLSSVNHQAYTGNQQDQVWGTSGLQGASQSLKTVIDDLKTSQNKESTNQG